MNIVLLHILSVVAFMIVSFAAQALSHFVINQEHFSSIAHHRQEPIIPLGLSAMIIQGIIMSVSLRTWRNADVTIMDGMIVSLAFGLFLSAYISLVEPAKYTVPDIAAWMRVETLVSAIQFVLFGLGLGLIHSKLGTAAHQKG